MNIDLGRLDDIGDDITGYGSLRVRNFEELASPTLADQTDEEAYGLECPKDVASNSGRNIEHLLTQENGKELEEGEICENQYEIVSEEEYFEEVSKEREDEKKESVRRTDVGESYIRNNQTHKAKTIPSRTEQGEWQCPHCDTPFTFKGPNFWRHNENVHKRFTCYCNQQFISRDHLNDHIKKVHEGQLGQGTSCEMNCNCQSHSNCLITHLHRTRRYEDEKAERLAKRRAKKRAKKRKRLQLEN